MAVPKSSSNGNQQLAYAHSAERYTAAQASFGNDVSGIPLIASAILICVVTTTPSVTLTLVDGSSLVVDGLVAGQQIPIRCKGVSAVTGVTSYIALFA